MASAVLDLPVVVGSRRLEVVSSTYGPSNSTILVGEASPPAGGLGEARRWLKGWRRTRQAQHRSAAQMAGQRPAWAFLQCASSGWTLTVKRGPFLALAQERNRVRLPSQITSLGRFYWLEGPGLSASHPPTLGRQVYVTQRSSCSCGWGMCSWPLRPTHMSVRTCNAG